MKINYPYNVLHLNNTLHKILIKKTTLQPEGNQKFNFPNVFLPEKMCEKNERDIFKFNMFSTNFFTRIHLFNCIFQTRKLS